MVVAGVLPSEFGIPSTGAWMCLVVLRQQVFTIDTKGKTDVILNEAANNAKIFERLGIKATRRYMQASLAGPNAGTFAVVIEYPSLAEMAAAQRKLQNDAEWQKYIDKIQGNDMVIESNSIWVEATP